MLCIGWQLFFFTILLSAYDIIVLWYRPISTDYLEWYLQRSPALPYEQITVVLSLSLSMVVLILFGVSIVYLKGRGIKPKAAWNKGSAVRIGSGLLIGCAYFVLLRKAEHVRLYMLLLPCEIYSLVVLGELFVHYQTYLKLQK